jgi:hypothetical protein
MVEVQESTQATVEELSRRLKRLEDRVAELEARRAHAAAAAVEEDTPQVPSLPRGGLALVGRTLVVLAGAYLVRALTDGRALPAVAGLTLGLAYAAVWQLWADREARRGRRESAAFHDLASSLIAFPLIWETAARLDLLSPRAAYAALVVFFALGLAVAVHRRLVVNATLTTALALVTGMALLASTHDLLAALVALLAIAAALEWLAFRDAWLGLRWGAALVLDAVALLTIAVVARPQLPEGYAPLARGDAALALLALPALYVVSVAARTLRHGRPVTCFEAAQGTTAVLLGFGGAWRVLAAEGGSAPAPAVLAALLGLLCYAVAFAHAERRPGQGRNFYFYATAGGLLTLGGTLGLGLGAGLPLVWTGLGLVAVGLGRRFRRATLRVHGALYLAAAALAAGLVAAGAAALAGLPPREPPRVAWAVVAGATLAWWILGGERSATAPAGAQPPRLVLALLTVLSLAAAARAAITATLGTRLAAAAAAETLAPTAVLVLLVLGLAWLAQRGMRELAWLVYPMLAVGALKLLLQDLRAGRPAMLVASLGLYGALLILVPRLLKPRDAPG